MEESSGKVLDFEKYKKKKENSEVDRKELLELIKKYIESK